MLAGTIALQRVQAVARRVAKIIEGLRTIEHLELVERAVLNVGRQLGAAQAAPDAFSSFVDE